MKSIFLNICSAAIALGILISLSGCGKKKTVDPVTVPTAAATPIEVTEAKDLNGLQELRKQLDSANAIAGIFCLGYYEGAVLDGGFPIFSEPYQNKFPFISNITQNARTEGGEIYCIIPADPEAEVVVTEWDETVVGTAGDTLYTSHGGEPFFVQGNISDIMPNLSVTITDSHGRMLSQYHPCISLKDGSICLPTDENEPAVMDLTQ